MNDFKEKMEQWSAELDFTMPLWSDPFRYLLAVNAAGTIAVVAALAQLWSSPSEIRASLLFGLKDFIYGMSFGFVIVAFSLFMIFFKRFVGFITTAFFSTEFSILIFKFFNLAWMLIYVGLIVVGYAHFFCNSFDIVEAVSSGLPADLKQEFLNPAKQCQVPRGIVHFTSNFLISRAPWEAQ